MGSHRVNGIQIGPAREPAASTAKQLHRAGPIGNLCRVAGQRSVAVGPVEWACRGNVALANIGPTRQSSIGPTRQSATATRESAATVVERRRSIRGRGAGRGGRCALPRPSGSGLGKSWRAQYRKERDSSNQRFHGSPPSNERERLCSPALKFESGREVVTVAQFTTTCSA